jgi:hypothetical protein
MNPCKYAIAKCSLGVYGVITVDEPQAVTYADGNTGVAWTGFVIRDTKILGIGGHSGKVIDVKYGNTWSSKKPEIIAQLSSVEDLSLEQLISHARYSLDSLSIY